MPSSPGGAAGGPVKPIGGVPDATPSDVIGDTAGDSISAGAYPGASFTHWRLGRRRAEQFAKHRGNVLRPPILEVIDVQPLANLIAAI